MVSFRQELLSNAKKALGLSYAPYSAFSVGTAIRCNDGSYILAANIESAVSAVGICAERMGLSLARMQKKTPTHIAICTHYNGQTLFETAPCGICRQMLIEFDGLKLVTDKKIASVRTLLPKPYTGRKAKQ